MSSIGSDFDRLLDEAVDVVFDASDLFDLGVIGHVVMDESEATVESHLDRHSGFGDGVHVGRNDGELKLQALGEADGELRVAGEDFGIARGEADVVEGESDGLAKKIVRRKVEVVRHGGGC